MIPEQSSRNEGINDGQTILDPQLVESPVRPEPESPAQPQPEPPAGPAAFVFSKYEATMVLATFCDRGHPNPTQRSVCHLCGAPVVSEPRRIERPQLGWVVVQRSKRIPVQGPLVFGRRPDPAQLRLRENVQLVTLPYAHVSRTHLVLNPDGWIVLARDLGSKNGTYLRRRSQKPMRLPEREVPLMAGDVLDLGAGVFIEMERLP